LRPRRLAAHGFGPGFSAGFGPYFGPFWPVFGPLFGVGFGRVLAGFRPLYPVLGGSSGHSFGPGLGPKGGAFWGSHRFPAFRAPKPVQQPLAPFCSVPGVLACFRPFSAPPGPKTARTLLVLPPFGGGLGALFRPVFLGFWPFPVWLLLGPPGCSGSSRFSNTKLVLFWFWPVLPGWLARCFPPPASPFPQVGPFSALSGRGLRPRPNMALTGPRFLGFWPVWPVFRVFLAFRAPAGPFDPPWLGFPGPPGPRGPKGPKGALKGPFGPFRPFLGRFGPQMDLLSGPNKAFWGLRPQGAEGPNGTAHLQTSHRAPSKGPFTPFSRICLLFLPCLGPQTGLIPSWPNS